MRLQTPNPGRAAEPDAMWFRERVSEVGEAFVREVKRIIDRYEREKEGFFRRKSIESKTVSRFFADFFYDRQSGCKLPLFNHYAT